MERGPAAVQLVTVSGGGSGGAVYSAQAHAHAHTQPPSLPSSAVVKVTTSLDGNEIRERERNGKPCQSKEPFHTQPDTYEKTHAFNLDLSIQGY